MIHRARIAPVALATYLPEQYPTLLATAEDANVLETTWKEWHQVLEQTKLNLALVGISFVEVTIDMDALAKYCLEHNLKNNSGTRAEFAARLLREQLQQQPQSPEKLKKRRKKRR